MLLVLLSYPVVSCTAVSNLTWAYCGMSHSAILQNRLKAEQMEAVFERKKRLLPRPTDLSFYNWDTQVSTSNATANFQVSHCVVIKRGATHQAFG